MPIFEYQCQACGHQFDVLQKVGEGALRKCPACGKLKLQRLVSAPNFHLKGSGWYKTDFRDKSKGGKEGEGATPTVPAAATTTVPAGTATATGGTPTATGRGATRTSTEVLPAATPAPGAQRPGPGAPGFVPPPDGGLRPTALPSPRGGT
jgi:putative FmdB family regulatory protein